MPYYGCTQWHHEFEAVASKADNPLCDWCGAPSRVLEANTPLERICEDKTIKKLLKELVAYDKKGDNIR